MQLNAPGLDLGEIEHLVDQVEQVLAGTLDAGRRLLEIVEAVILGVLAQHLDDADDGIKRRAQLVAHVGQELALCLGCGLGGCKRVFHFLLGKLELGNVADGAGHAIDEAGFVAHANAAMQDPADVAIDVGDPNLAGMGRGPSFQVGADRVPEDWQILGQDALLHSLSVTMLPSVVIPMRVFRRFEANI